jgi:hypothetical protein
MLGKKKTKSLAARDIASIGVFACPRFFKQKERCFCASMCLFDSLASLEHHFFAAFQGHLCRVADNVRVFSFFSIFFSVCVCLKKARFRS